MNIFATYSEEGVFIFIDVTNSTNLYHLREVIKNIFLLVKSKQKDILQHQKCYNERVSVNHSNSVFS